MLAVIYLIFMYTPCHTMQLVPRSIYVGGEFLLFSVVVLAWSDLSCLRWQN